MLFLKNKSSKVPLLLFFFFKTYLCRVAIAYFFLYSVLFVPRCGLIYIKTQVFPVSFYFWGKCLREIIFRVSHKTTNLGSRLRSWDSTCDSAAIGPGEEAATLAVSAATAFYTHKRCLWSFPHSQRGKNCLLLIIGTRWPFTINCGMCISAPSPWFGSSDLLNSYFTEEGSLLK